MSCSPPDCNIELKARLDDLQAARELAASLATEPGQVVEQTDVYYRCAAGRLKLRVSSCGPAQLVAYRRADVATSKASDYHLLDVDDPQRLAQMLSETLGVRCVVRKRREVFLYHNVRIHLDEVASLGTFLEFEAVLSDEISPDEGHSQIAYLSEVFRIEASDLLRGSYCDMVRPATGEITPDLQ
ncbi:MAG: CYTH domain-containing protein [Planctomycetota bacterium]|nr:MAG: CYTH domain-containing protein [Planctomycetota bacterium]REJ95673.1 MAG: CYTH domain-containing protein [Planctomycetota bacterium]REK29184.1 MAG: CYTH domain-containing protein [Planctomycetota bacterium]REK46974.1 MAG: CYTH domain-containing protein [Planctomycetota bacterium]